MKIKSAEKDVYIEKWKTPISHVPATDLELSGVLQSPAGYTHLFFVIQDGIKRNKYDIHVVTIGLSWPFRLIGGEFAIGCIGRYLAPDPSQKGKVSKHLAAESCTWKLWGSRFVHELDIGGGLSLYMGTPKEIYECLIQTKKEWIEIVSGPLHWQLLKNTTIKGAMSRLLNKPFKR